MFEQFYSIVHVYPAKIPCFHASLSCFWSLTCGKMNGMPPRIGFRPSKTDFLLTKSCSWNWNHQLRFHEEGRLKAPYYPERSLKFRLQNVWDDICRVVGAPSRQSGVPARPDCMQQTHNFASAPTARTVLRGLYAHLNDRPAAPLYSFMPTCRSGWARRRRKGRFTWLLTLQETMVAPCKLIVQVVLLPRSMGTTGTEAAIFVIPPFQPTVFTTPDREAI